MDPAPTYIGAATAAARLGISTDTIRQWIREGRLPAVRLPGGRGRYRIDERDLLLVLEPGADAARGGPVGPKAA